MTEGELRSLISRSRKDGFRELFREYRGYVYSIVWKKICSAGTREDAEECISDIFSHIFLHFDEIETGKLKTYISIISGGMAVDKYRSLTAGKNIHSEDDEILESVSSGEDIVFNTENAEQSKRLFDIVQSLGEPDATIIIHRYYYDHTSAEIGKHLGLSPVNVRMRLSRSMKRLKKLLLSDEKFFK